MTPWETKGSKTKPLRGKDGEGKWSPPSILLLFLLCSFSVQDEKWWECVVLSFCLSILGRRFVLLYLWWKNLALASLSLHRLSSKFTEREEGWDRSDQEGPVNFRFLLHFLFFNWHSITKEKEEEKKKEKNEEKRKRGREKGQILGNGFKAIGLTPV